MTIVKPNLINMYHKYDVRVLYDCLEKYEYTQEEINDVINNCYKLVDKTDTIPEIEHILFLLYEFPHSNITEETFNASCRFSGMVEFINNVIPYDNRFIDSPIISLIEKRMENY
jgi:hypothetical protein